MIEAWKDYGGLGTFTHEGTNWHVQDHVGRGMTFSCKALILIVDMEAYPTPDFALKVLKDFYRCNPKTLEGEFEWKGGAWHEVKG